ncbi:carbohydrate-binding-like protein [Russula aff. rugulosa BPL654]|nr:carbohydrate-binding-like protein [Russula aff. rugulosa BPL654]
MRCHAEDIYLVGSIDALKYWLPDNALSLNPANYPTWSVNVTLPEDTIVHYKYIRKFHGRVTWESDPNRVFTTPGSGKVFINDTWQ